MRRQASCSAMFPSEAAQRKHEERDKIHMILDALAVHGYKAVTGQS